MDLKRFLMNCGLLSVDRYTGMLNGTINWYRNTFAVCPDVFMDVRIGRDILKHQSSITSTCLCTCVVFGRGQSISITTNSGRLVTGRSFILCLLHCHFRLDAAFVLGDRRV